MWTRRPTKLAPLALAATLAITGCATIRQSEAHDTGRLLAEAGFTMQDSDTTDHQLPYRLVSQTKDGVVAYTYADPQGCKCLYVGGAKEYAEYQRLAKKQKAPEWLRDAEETWTDLSY